MPRRWSCPARLGVVAGVLAAAALPAAMPLAALTTDQATPSASELKQLPIEDLLDVEITSAAKRPQPLTETAAAISVLTGEELRRSGVRSLPEALRLAAGLHVARFASRSWAISARGFNASASNKMLVTIDGRSVYTPLFSGVFWDVQNPLLEDVDRIEVVRGPGATLWGANAVNGVINVITRQAADTQGSLAVLAAGDEQRTFAAFRHGGRLGRGHYRAYAEYDSRDALVLPTGSSAHDPLRIAQAGFRADFATPEGDLTVHGDLYGGQIGHPTLPDTDVDGGNLVASWTRHLGVGSDLTVRSYYDRTFRRSPQQFREERNTLDLEAQHRWQRGGHDLLWGAGYRSSRDRVGNSAQIRWDPTAETIQVGSLFVQDQIRLARRWRAQLGVRLEDHSTMSPQVLPAGTLGFQLSPHRLLWAGAGRAVRAPTRIDRDIRVFSPTGALLITGNEGFDAEDAVAYELGYRMAVGGRALFEAVAFHNDYDHLRTQEPTPPSGLPLRIDNRARGESRGAGVAGSWQALARLRLIGALTVLRSRLELDPGSGDTTGGSAEANDPGHYWTMRAELDLPRNIELDGSLRSVGALSRPDVPGYTELDLRLGWQRPGGWNLALVGQNLLHDRHPEFGAATSREEVQRGVYAQVSWRR